MPFAATFTTDIPAMIRRDFHKYLWLFLAKATSGMCAACTLLASGDIRTPESGGNPVDVAISAGIVSF